METYEYERCDNIFICLSELIDHMLRVTKMNRTDVFSYTFRMIKGHKDVSPLNVYRKPLNCLPFDDFERIDGAELGMLMEELRDCAHREAESYSIIDYVKREAAIKRLEAADIPTEDISLERASAKPVKPVKERESGALLDAYWILMHKQGYLEMPKEKVANILSETAKIAGLSRTFDASTIARWLAKSSKVKAA